MTGVAVAVGAGVSAEIGRAVTVAVASTLVAVTVGVLATGVGSAVRSAVGCGVSRIPGSVGRKSSKGAEHPSALDGIQPNVICRFQARIHRLSLVRP
jgi:hypothetical protein